MNLETHFISSSFTGCLRFLIIGETLTTHYFDKSLYSTLMSLWWNTQTTTYCFIQCMQCCLTLIKVKTINSFSCWSDMICWKKSMASHKIREIITSIWTSMTQRNNNMHSNIHDRSYRNKNNTTHIQKITTYTNQTNHKSKHLKTQHQKTCKLRNK